MPPAATSPVPPALQSLDEVPLGEARLVASIAGVDAAVANRLIEMGFDEGVEVVPLHAAPFGGDPIAVRIGSTKIALRRALARAVLVAARA